LSNLFLSHFKKTETPKNNSNLSTTNPPNPVDRFTVKTNLPEQ